MTCINSPLIRYQQDLNRSDFEYDKAQETALQALQTLHIQVCEHHNQHNDISGNKLPLCNSLYIWGKVGRGKTYLMDCFYESLPIQNKMRQHFYRFMRQTHLDLKQHQGHKNPLALIAQDIANQARVLCFDEFFVSDIGDAMILGQLLGYLFELGVAVIATSNVEPNELYKDGLQRDRFLHSIDLIYQHMSVLHMDGQTDHRLRSLPQNSAYYVSSSVDAEIHMQQRFFKDTNQTNILQDQSILVEHRKLETKYLSDTAVWFEFEQLCLGPRSQNDYITLAQRYKTVYISRVPQMGGELNEKKVARGTEDTYNINQRVADRPFMFAKDDDAARRFISLIDVFYDQQVKLILSAEVPILELYIGGRVAFEFERTISRLIEMQSEQYLSS